MQYDRDTSKLSEWVLKTPFRLLALQMSCPWRSPVDNEENSAADTTVEVYADQITVRIPRSTQQRPVYSSPILASKESFLLGALILREWQEVCKGKANPDGAPESVKGLRANCLRLSVDLATMAHGSPTSKDGGGLATNLHMQELALSRLQESLRLSTKSEDDTLHEANLALRDLERAGLLVDPAFAGAEGTLIFLGLTPVRFSNRTEYGESIVREIKIQAALWDFAYESEKPRRGKRFSRRWSFNVRGVSFVRRLLRDMALQYLSTERDLLQQEDRPVSLPPERLSLPGDRPTESDEDSQHQDIDGAP